ncbi:hypothetical protein ACFYV7_34140 [Nocardia suismassiliense]|uniref:Uncharacterized protein n=1 Tax=Nocardia suismassiliense TaxID=2077092 RepID=A0ABW6R2Y7_9NOCA
MSIKRSEALGGRGRITLLAIGLLGASTLGYGVFAGPDPVANAEAAEAFKCVITEASVAITKDSDTKGNPTFMADLNDAKFKEKTENCDTETLSGVVHQEGVEFKEDGNDCVIKISKKKVDAAAKKADVELGGKEVESGEGTITVPLDGGEGTIEATVKTTKDSDKGKGEIQAKGSLTGLKLDSCAAEGLPDKVTPKLKGEYEFTPSS